MKDMRLSWVTSLAAALISLSAAILVPVTYWWSNYQGQIEEISNESRLSSQFINDFIRRNPASWQTQAASLENLLRRVPAPQGPAEIRVMEDLGGRTLAGGNRWLNGPLVSGTESIYSGAQEVGKIRISRSLEPMVRRTGLAILLGLALGMLMFVFLRVLPLRALHHAHTRLHREKEQLRIVVDYALDAIISMSRDGVIESFNPAAARTFGYRAREIIGQHIQMLLPGFEPGRTILSMEKKETGETVEGLGRRQNQQIFPVEYALSSATECGKLICVVRDITERKQAQKSLAFLANYDSLTRLPNRALFRERLAQAMARAKRSEKLAALMFLDLDRFKIINDSLGHAIGDKLLQAVAQRLTHTLRATDTIIRNPPAGTIGDCGEATLSRLGGDEFTIILEGISHVNDAATAAQKIIDAMAVPFELDGHGVYVTASIGITLFPFDDSDIDLLIKHADTAMYRSKQLGRNDYHFYSEDMNTQAHERLAMELSLRQALSRQEFSLCYQPRTRIDTGELTGVEALLRWDSPHFGKVPPEKFIPILEDMGLIAEVGEWTLRNACKQILAWQQVSHLNGTPLSINLSAKQFKQPNLFDCTCEVLRETGLDPRRLELEITESVLMDQTESTARTLNMLTDLGVTIALDDFGTGYSSLSYLTRFPIHTLKIAPSFIRDITGNPNDAAIIQAIVAIGASLQFDVVAEGVDTEEQKNLLHRLGCLQIQGHLIAPVLSAEALEHWLHSRF